MTKEERNTKAAEQQKIINKMELVSSYLSIITLNVNVLNAPIKRHRVAKWTKKQEDKTQLSAAYKTLTSALRTYIGSK